MDFFQIFDDKEVMMEIPVRIVGNSRGVKNGGVLRIVNRKLRVKAVPENLPDFIEIDITEMKIGDIRTVASVLSDDYKIMHEENRTICQVRTSRTAIVDEVDDEDEDEEGVEGEEGAEAPAEGEAAEASAEE
jgi:large subunit ribosomal protein L25